MTPVPNLPQAAEPVQPAPADPLGEALLTGTLANGEGSGAAAPRPEKPAAEEPPPGQDTWGYDLLLYGNEQILRGSDSGTLVAFGALAFQQLRGKSEPHQNIGCGILLFSVLMCAIVHLAIGASFVGRGRRLLRGAAQRRAVGGGLALFVAVAAAVLQCAFIVLGLILILSEGPPEFLEGNLLQWFD